ncbi:MAG: hypothetical protein LBB94_01415 [Clostridiales bacterium]|jgi:hypothetical protein|nr:hypothetical protein [Clostridiales bacterium]
MEKKKISEYKPRNSVVAAKEKLYGKVNISVSQVDRFIIACITVIVVLVVLSVSGVFRF